MSLNYKNELLKHYSLTIEFFVQVYNSKIMASSRGVITR